LGHATGTSGKNVSPARNRCVQAAPRRIGRVAPADGSPIHVISYDGDGLEEADADHLAEARRWVGRRRVTWINVERVDDPEVLASLERDFGIHPLTAEDVRNTRQRPKVEQYAGYVYVVAQMIKREEADGELDTEQVSLLLGDGWVITLQDKPGDVFEDVRERLRTGRARIRGSGADYLVYALLDAVVDAYFPILDAVGTRAELIEDRVLEEATLTAREDLQVLRRELLTLRRVAFPQRDAVAALERGEHPWFTAETRTFLRDVTDHATRVLDFVETNRELAASLMDLYAAGVAQRTNETMKVLTLVATIFIPLTFIAGVYGMNFRHMPELEYRYGYPLALGGMSIIGVAMYLAFRKRGWV
jgi:magnesium transporter